MPFRAKRRHEIWTADVRYVPHSIPNTKTAYVTAILENYSRCVLASAISVTQGTTPSCASSTLLLTPFESLRQTLS